MRLHRCAIDVTLKSKNFHLDMTLMVDWALKHKITSRKNPSLSLVCSENLQDATRCHSFRKGMSGVLLFLFL